MWVLTKDDATEKIVYELKRVIRWQLIKST